jgi:hypothetical protein
LRHIPVQKNQIDRVCFKGLESLLAIARLKELAGNFQLGKSVFYNIPHDAAVVNNQNSFHIYSPQFFAVFDGSCSKTEVSEQLYYTKQGATDMRQIKHQDYF